MSEDKIKPSHYKSDNDVIKFCLDNDMGFVEGNVLKYVRRWKEKNGVEDLLKAKEYLNRLIDSIKPKYIIADGSNYKSYIEYWENICKKRKLPFHQTSKNGAFIIDY